MKGGIFMWERIGTFIVEYWVELLLTSIVGAATYFVKRHGDLRLQAKNAEQEKFKQEIINGVETEFDTFREGAKKIDKAFRAEIDEIKQNFQNQVGDINNNLDDLKKGLLSIQGTDFKEICHLFLEPDHTLTFEEYKLVINEHETFKALGGDSEGDELFNLLQEKAKEIIRGKSK